MTSFYMKRSNRYMVFDVDVENATFVVMFPTTGSTLSIIALNIGYTTIGGCIIFFFFQTSQSFYCTHFAAVSYKTFSLTVGRGRGRSI